jgi:hypothetical protein
VGGGGLLVGMDLVVGVWALVDEDGVVVVVLIGVLLARS